MNKRVYEVKGQLQVSVPKTKASIRRLVLPPGVVEVLRQYQKTVDSRWMFPSPVKEDMSMTPGAVRRRLQIILERAGCKRIRFHDLRHTFATLSLESGMDVKTLSAMLGHVSAATTLDIYTHITNPMRSEAAAKIDQRIGKAAPQESPAEPQEKWAMTTFQPYVGRKRKSGTGCITQISENCWEGRYSPVWPDGKKHSRNVYAKTREECETLLPGLIQQMKAEIRAIKESGNLDAIPDGISEKKKAIAAYMRKYPEVTSKSAIAKAVQVDKNTVNRYYEEIRREMD